MQKTYTLSPAQIDALRQLMAKHNYVVPAGNAGTISGSGVTLGYAYDGLRVLSLTIEQKPPFLPTVGMIWSEIDSFVREALA